MSTTTPTAARNRSRSVRWLRRPSATEAGRLAINAGNGLERLYEVTAVVCDRTAQVLGYHLDRLDGKAYDINAETWECDCPDMTYREKRCKHSLGLEAGLRAIGQLQG